MPVNDMAASGSNAYVARLIGQGYGRDFIEARLRREYPSEAPRSIDAAYERGQRAYYAGEALTAAGAEGRVLAHDIPTGSSRFGGYRYYATATLLDLQSGAAYVRSFIVESALNLTLGAVAADVQQMALERYGPYARRREYQDLPGGLLATDLQVIAIERAAL